MAHHETLFSTRISYGSKGGPMFFTDIITLDSGRENRIGRSSTPLHRYDVAFGVKSIEDMYNLKTFYIARQGALHSFNYKDWFDFTTASDGTGAVDDEDVLLGTGDGSDQTFQLVKYYAEGPTTRTRNITKPVAGTLVVSLNGVNTTAFTVDNTTGVVTMNSAPGIGIVVKAGFQFYVPVRFDESTDEWLQATYQAYELGNAPNIGLVEVRDELEVAEEYFYGSSIELAISADRQMSANEARVWTVSPTTGGLKLKMPDITDLASGAEWFRIINLSGSNTVLIREFDDTAIMTLGTNTGIEVVISKATDGTKAWEMF